MTTAFWIAIAILAWPTIIFIGLIVLIVYYVRKDNKKSRTIRYGKNRKRKQTIIPMKTLMRKYNQH